MASWMGCEGSAREPRALGVGAVGRTAWDWQSGGQEESGSGESWNWGPTRHPLPGLGPPIPEGGLAAPDAAPELPAPLRRPSSSWGGPDTARTDRSARPPPFHRLLSGLCSLGPGLGGCQYLNQGWGAACRGPFQASEVGGSSAGNPQSWPRFLGRKPRESKCSGPAV